MSRILTLILGSVILSTSGAGCAVAQPQCNNGVVCEDREHVQDFWYSYYRNKHWPAPFRQMDTSAWMAHFEVQRDNGWKLHNTLTNGMFDTSTCDLNATGEAHLEWIVTRAPQNRRVVFVRKGDDAETTAKRIESTQIAISELLPTGDLPPIYLTDREPAVSAGAYQTAITRAINTSVPAPRLPANTAAASSGSSGS